MTVLWWRIPPYWLAIRARHAVDPAIAILNYAYAVLEGQVRMTLSAAGFDLACGFLKLPRFGGSPSSVHGTKLCIRRHMHSVAA
jgi:hypothetical protein